MFADGGQSYIESYWEYIGVVLGLYWGYMGIMEKKMESTIVLRRNHDKDLWF